MEAYKKRQKRKRRNQIVIASVIIIVIIVIAYGLITLQPNYLTIPVHTPDPSTLPSLPTIGPNTPTPFHWHAHLDVFINGTPVIVPSDLGHVQGDAVLYALHTHDATGLIHIEYSTKVYFTLMQIFEVWGYPTFSANHLFTYSGQSNAIYINGTQISFNPNYYLTCHDEIAIVYGTAPSHIPSSYSFGAAACEG